MGVSKESKNKIMNLLIQRVSTEDIAKKLHYSVGTIRKVFEEFREEYGVSTTKEIADIYLDSLLVSELSNLSKCINSTLKKIKSRNFATIKNADDTGKSTENKKRKNKKNKNK